MRHEKRKPFSDDIRGRLKRGDSSDSIDNIWAEQRAISKKEALRQEKYRQAKKKARELRKSILKDQFGDGIDNIFKLVANVKVSITKFLTRLGIKSRLSYLGLFASIILIGVLGFRIILQKHNSTTATLGEFTGISSSEGELPDLPREKPKFTLLFPSNKTESDYDVVRISPENSEASYTFLDKFNESDQIFRVTQQETPKDFDLEKTATSFQATNIIQIDETIVYHGYSEKGRVQSLIFIKEGKLISISSPEKYSDDKWVGYILTLQ